MKTGRAAARVAALLAAGALLAACHHAVRPAAAESRSRVDSIVGIVRVVGVDQLPQVTLALDDASPAVSLDGPASLRRVAGLRIAVVGERTGARLVVRRFTVLAANGVPAIDGIITADGESVALVTQDGTRHRLVHPPQPLRANIGHRAWVSGPLDREPVAFGIIE